MKLFHLLVFLLFSSFTAGETYEDLIEMNFIKYETLCDDLPDLPICSIIGNYLKGVIDMPGGGDEETLLSVITNYLDVVTFETMTSIDCDGAREIAQSKSECIPTGFTTNDVVLQSEPSTCIPRQQSRCIDTAHYVTLLNEEECPIFLHTVWSAAQFQNDSLRFTLDSNRTPKFPEEIESEDDNCLIAYAGVYLPISNTCIENIYYPVDFIVQMTALFSDPDDLNSLYDLFTVIEQPDYLNIYGFITNYDPSKQRADSQYFYLNLPALNLVKHIEVTTNKNLRLQQNILERQKPSVNYTVETLEYTGRMLTDNLDIFITPLDLPSLTTLIAHTIVAYGMSPEVQYLPNVKNVHIISNDIFTISEAVPQIEQLYIEGSSHSPLRIDLDSEPAVKRSIEDGVINLKNLTLVNRAKFYSIFDVEIDYYFRKRKRLYLPYYPINLNTLLELPLTDLFLDGIIVDDSNVIYDEVFTKFNNLHINGLMGTHVFTLDQCTGSDFVFKGLSLINPYQCNLSDNTTYRSCFDTLCVSDYEQLQIDVAELDENNALLSIVSTNMTEIGKAVGSVLQSADDDSIDLFTTVLSFYATSNWLFSHAYPFMHVLTYPTKVTSDFVVDIDEMLPEFAFDMYALQTTILADNMNSTISFFNMINPILGLLTNLGHLSITYDESTTPTPFVTAHTHEGKNIGFPTLLSYKLDYSSREVDCSFIDVMNTSPNLMYIDVKGDFVNCQESGNALQLTNLRQLSFIRIIAENPDGVIMPNLFDNDFRLIIPVDFIDDIEQTFEKPDDYYLNSNLAVVYLDNIKINTTINKFISLFTFGLYMLVLRNCNLEGTMSRISDLYGLSYLDLSNNENLSGDITHIFYWLDYEQMTYFDIRGTAIYGTINVDNFDLCIPEYLGECYVNENIDITECPPCEYRFIES